MKKAQSGAKVAVKIQHRYLNWESKWSAVTHHALPPPNVILTHGSSVEPFALRNWRGQEFDTSEKTSAPVQTATLPNNE